MIAVIVIVALVALLYYLFPLVTVIGESMFPTYKHGEVLISTRAFSKKHIKVGDVVLYYAPYDDEKRVVIKRISEVNVEGNLMYCLGDNSSESYDSRAYGYVSLDNLVSKVLRPRKQKARYQ